MSSVLSSPFLVCRRRGVVPGVGALQRFGVLARGGERHCAVPSPVAGGANWRGSVVVVSETWFTSLTPLETREGARRGSTGRVAAPLAQIGGSGGSSERQSVGMSQGTESGAVGKFEGKGPHVGKSEAGPGKVEGVGQAGGQSAEEGGGIGTGTRAGQSVGKEERGDRDAVGKSVGKAANLHAAGKAGVELEGGAGTAGGESVGAAAEGQGVGKGEAGDGGKGGQGHAGGRAGVGAEKQSAGWREFVIAAAGKSEAERRYVESVVGGGELKLPDGGRLAAHERAAGGDDGFGVDVFMEQLTTRRFGRVVFHARELPSTHTLLSQNCKSLPVGTLSVADIQFQGKGRGGNAWESPKGCLMFSFTVEMWDGRAVPFLQYVASLAIIEGIESHCASKGRRSPEVRIKWPNDLYAKGVKVGGVLCTSSYGSKKFSIVVGVGLNVGNRQPTTCLDALVEEVNGEACALRRDELLAAIMGKFEELFEVFSSRGFGALESDYYRRWLHSGQTVVLEERQEGESEASRVALKIEGLTASGYLRGVDDASEAYELHPDGNSFDFLHGLVRRKM